MLIRIIVFALVINSYSCRINEKTGYVGKSYIEKTVTIIGYNQNHEEKDTLGMVTFKISKRLDTFYKWIQWSDCGLPCAFSNYRFADRHYNQIAESGFFLIYHPDSLYQFSIQHKPIKELPDSFKLNSLSRRDTSFIFHYLTLNLCVCEDFNFYKKEIKLINNRSFVITGFNTGCGHLSWKKTIYLVGSTKLKDRYIHFIGECSAKDTTCFFNDIYKTLLSIKIKEK